MIKNWIGIIGNVGPEADEILQKYLRLEMQKRGALNDQDYLPMFIVKNPAISDRTAAIFHGGVSPAVGILETCRILAKNGVFYAALPSNTSHYFYDEFQSQTDVYVIHLLDITSEYIHKAGEKSVGVLCTSPTKKTEIYTKSFAKYGIAPVYPSDSVQELCVQNAIYGDPTGKAHHERLPNGLKSGNKREALQKLSEAVTELTEKHGCQSILFGCTEIPTVAEPLQAAFPKVKFIDPMEILALRAIEIKEAVDKQINSNARSRVFKIDDIQNVQDIAEYVVFKMNAMN